MKDYYNRPRFFEYKVVGTVVILIAILILFLALFSCTKERDFCWECVSIKIDRINTCYPIMAKPDTFELCFKTEDWIRKYEKSNTFLICDDLRMLKCVKE